MRFVLHFVLLVILCHFSNPMEILTPEEILKSVISEQKKLIEVLEDQVAKLISVEECERIIQRVIQGNITITDICDGGNHNCSEKAYCTSLVAGGHLCTCLQGYSGDGFICEDINECQTRQYECEVGDTCVNTDGDYICQPQNATLLSGDCEEGGRNCGENAKCSNFSGSYWCTCQLGYSGNGFTCEDINECEIGQYVCDEGDTCVNNDGDYICQPPDVTLFPGICEEGNHICSENADCTTSNSSYFCICHSGYSGDGVTCEDINECETGEHLCGLDIHCTNTLGGYTCKELETTTRSLRQDSICPESFEYFESLGCVSVVDRLLEWREAKENCYQKNSSRLLEYSSKGHFEALKYHFGHIGYNMWVGMKNQRWVDSNKRPLKELWRPGQPEDLECGYVWLGVQYPGLGMNVCTVTDASLCQIVID